MNKILFDKKLEEVIEIISLDLTEDRFTSHFLSDKIKLGPNNIQITIVIDNKYKNWPNKWWKGDEILHNLDAFPKDYKRTLFIFNSNLKEDVLRLDGCYLNSKEFDSNQIVLKITCDNTIINDFEDVKQDLKSFIRDKKINDILGI
jgi:hypothetical protein